jgi:hypothetical protein
LHDLAADAGFPLPWRGSILGVLGSIRADGSDDHLVETCSLSPAGGETLLRGATVSVSLTVASESPGRLSLSIRDQAGARLLTSEPSVELVPRQDTSIQASFAVPQAASSIDVFAYLRDADSATPTVIHIGYVAR